jgi:hypothetical protein
MTVAEVERRLRVAFAYVRVDLEEGARSILKRAEWIDALPAAFYQSKYPAIAARRANMPDRAKALRALPFGAAAGFTVGDDAEGLTVHFVLIPGDAIMFGYSGSAEERALRPLVDRCAEALDSDVILV